MLNFWLEINPSVFYGVALIVTILVLFVTTKLIHRKYTPSPVSPTVLATSVDKEEQDRGPAHAGGSSLKGNSSNDEDGINADDIDPVMYVEHIQSEVKRAKSRVTNKELIKDLSDQQIEEERTIRNQQLESIYNLMMEQKDKFGIDSMDDIQQQLKLYA